MDDETPLLEKPCEVLPGIGKKNSETLCEKKIFKVRDLLFFFPRRYEDRCSLMTVRDALKSSENSQSNIKKHHFSDTKIFAVFAVCRERSSFRFKNRSIKKFFFEDATQSGGKADVFTLSAFDPSFALFKKGELYILYGRLKKRYGEIQMLPTEYEHFDVDALRGLKEGHILPVYPGLSGFSQKRIRSVINKVFKLLPENALNWELPPFLVKKYNFFSKKEALKTKHFPSSHADYEKARSELAFEEAYLFLKKVYEEKKKLRGGKDPNRYAGRPADINEFIDSLPFELTSGQKKAVNDIVKDMKSSTVMRRLVQGDVGSGKTLVSVCAVFLAASAGYQCAVMGATEILARQLFSVYKALLTPFGISVEHLSKSKNAVRERILNGLRCNEVRVVVGTHALFQKDVEFFDLKLAVIDEQHRFGVDQRNALWEKGKAVDLITMSATPIPRSLCLTAFGDFDVSILPDLPSGRLNRLTRVVDSEERKQAYRFVLKRIGEGEQAYVVFPAIEESQKKDVRSLKKVYRQLKESLFKTVPTALVHGQMPSEEIRDVMNLFKRGEIKVLFATTLIEVGIDNPNVTVVVIESAENFGLAQLHQIRGRVGRGSKQGYAFAVIEKEISETAFNRLKIFSENHDGFRIAEADLSQRGPGDILGTRQAGLPEFVFLDLKKDQRLLLRAQAELT